MQFLYDAINSSSYIFERIQMLFTQEYLVPERTISKWALHKVEIVKRRKIAAISSIYCNLSWKGHDTLCQVR